MRLTSTCRTVSKNCGVKAIEYAFDQKLCCQVEHFHRVHVLIKRIIKSVLLFPRATLAYLIFDISLREVLRILQNDNFFVQNFD